MDKEQIKKFIAEKVASGLSLSAIQDALREQNVKITFMDLRLLATELESVDWRKTDKPEPKAEAKELSKAAPQGGAPAGEEDAFEDDPAAGLPPQGDALDGELPEEAPAGQGQEAAPAAEAPAGPRGKTTVALNKLVKPGMLASGTVDFGSGVKAGWFLDQLGRLGLEKASGKPDAKDVEEFQVELQKLFEKQGL